MTAFDLLTVKRMIEYLYTKDYKVDVDEYKCGDKLDGDTEVEPELVEEPKTTSGEQSGNNTPGTHTPLN